ncbi:hypothetical protein FRC17_001512 [Serendipita sp. 399]|nr:hypothetical protein FRC17_001512 [Serendipita sp. 399]
MSQPTHTVGNHELQFEMPPGWSVAVNAISRRDYSQLIAVSSNRTSHMKMLLGNKTGKSDEEMENLQSRDSFVAIPATDTEATKIVLKCYYSQGRLTTNALSSLENSGNASHALHVTKFNKPQGTPSHYLDYTTFIIYVQAGPDVGSLRSYDAVITMTFTQKMTLNVDLNNVQGDIVPGLPKAIEYFYFFQVVDVNYFRRAIKSFVVPNTTTAQYILNNRTQIPPPGGLKPGTQFVGMNIGFSVFGLIKLGLVESLQDEAFHKGQRRDAKDLGDTGREQSGTFNPAWDREFLTDIDGVFQVTAHDEDKARAFLQEIDRAFGRIRSARSGSIHQVLLQRAAFRPPPETPNEHFGFRDGISKPEIKGVTFDDQNPMRFPGSPVVPLGLIVMGHDGDVDKANRPPWAKDGSFLVFRKLKSLVPEFNMFLRTEGPRLFPDMHPSKAADRLGARLFGRWKSGTPIVLSPHEDNPEIAKNNKLLNDFKYSNDQTSCPFSAHTRKAYPRNDMPGSNAHLFRRQGIPYGPELGPGEEHVTLQDRGLIFLAYQSSLVRGFKFIQQNSYNNPNFPAGKANAPGYDPILGSNNNNTGSRSISGADPSSPMQQLAFPTQFVESKGGEYFFVPSISTLRDRIGM